MHHISAQNEGKHVLATSIFQNFYWGSMPPDPTSSPGEKRPGDEAAPDSPSGVTLRRQKQRLHRPTCPSLPTNLEFCRDKLRDQCQRVGYQSELKFRKVTSFLLRM